MSSAVNWSNPYARRQGVWLKGNLHAHSSPASHCGQVPVERVLELYAAAGYDFLALSDHLSATEGHHDRLILIPGMEWNSVAGEHTGISTTDWDLLRSLPVIEDHDELLATLADTAAVVTLNHPNWQLTPHYRWEELLRKGPYDGIEIYDALIEHLDGCALATDVWDYLLSRGRRVLGFACDDSHIEEDIAEAWIAVRSVERTAAAVLEAVRNGNFYASNGVVIHDIRRVGNEIRIESADAQEIQARGFGGQLLARIPEKRMVFDTTSTESVYVRFELYGQGSARAWTQPFFPHDS